MGSQTNRFRLVAAAGALLVGIALAAHWRPHRPLAVDFPKRVAARAGAPSRREPAFVRGRGEQEVAALCRNMTFPPKVLDLATLQLSLTQWARNDPASAIDWLSELPGCDAKSRLVASAGIALAPTDLQAAVDLAGTLPAGGERHWLVAGIVRIWSQSDPAATASWIAPLREGPERIQAVRTLATNWAASDASAARRWLETLPPSESQEEGLAVLAESTTE